MHLPPYPKHPVLKAGAYTLRPIISTDIENILDLSFGDGKPAETIEQAKQIQARVGEDYQKGGSIHWGIADINNNIIGTCGYYRSFKDKGEIGFVLKESHRGKGIMQQAIKSIIHFGIETMRLDYIFSITSTNNPSAIKLFDKINAIKIKEKSGEVEYQLYKRA